jgi:glycopeptide antibiotics resistance protein
MTSNAGSWVADLGPRDYAFAVGLVLVLLVVLARRHRAGRPALILDGLFGTYLIFLAVVVFCPLPGLTPPPSFAQIPAVSVNTTMDLHGFLGGGLDNQNRQNLLLLVPFGFGLPFVVRWRGWALVAASAILPLGIEGLQLLVSLGVGWRYRGVDLNDWVANTAGVLLGLALFVELTWALPRARAPAGSSNQIVNPDERGVTVIGQAPAGTSRAVVALPDGLSADAKLHQVQGLSDWLVYSAELGRSSDGSSSVRVEFFDADGKPW